MGADKVFLKSNDASDVTTILTGAADFFNSFFTNTATWNKKCIKFERGAWIRLYGTPLQAWNEFFFLFVCS
jgi:hypothetical protein